MRYIWILLQRHFYTSLSLFSDRNRNRNIAYMLQVTLHLVSAYLDVTLLTVLCSLSHSHTDLSSEEHHVIGNPTSLQTDQTPWSSIMNRQETQCHLLLWLPRHSSCKTGNNNREEWPFSSISNQSNDSKFVFCFAKIRVFCRSETHTNVH